MAKVKFDFKIKIKTKGFVAFIIVITLMVTYFVCFAMNDPQNGSDPALAQYVGNTSTKRFHYSDCRYASQISEKNVIYFSDISETDGYDSCSVCKPQ